MLSRYEALSRFRPHAGSDIMLRIQVLAGEVYRQRAYADYILRQMFPTTAEGDYLDAHAAQRGLSRKSATKAGGTVIFSADAEEHGDILIPAGTVVCTAKDLLRFVTDEDVTLGASAQEARAAVTAAEAGSAYNIGAGTIGIIVTPIAGVSSVRNISIFKGGNDTESDEALRERVVDSIRYISNGTNAAYYRSVAMSVEGVHSASVVGRGRGAGTVDVYVFGRDAVVSNETLREIQTILDTERELNVDVKVKQPAAVFVNLYIRLSVEDGYDFDTVAGEVQRKVREYINTLGLGHDVLLSQIGDLIYHMKGVNDYKFLETYGSDRSISDAQYPVALNILVRSE